MYTCKTHFTVSDMNWFGCKPGGPESTLAWACMGLNFPGL